MNAASRKATEYRQKGPPALDLIEQAVHLIRQNTGALSLYYVGAIPFAVSFLFFCAEMSRSAFAEGKLPGLALLVGVSYIWMKYWQSVFARRLHSIVVGEKPRLPGPGTSFKLIVSQAALQPSGFFVLPLAFVIALPFAWVSAFYQMVSVLGECDNGRVRPLMRSAYAQAMLWPRQNHVLVLSLFGFSLIVFVNWATVVLMLPMLLKMFFGFESVFTRMGVDVILNTTFLMAVICLTFLSVDPLRKAVYVLRSFYARSLLSGDDIKAELQRLSERQVPRGKAPAIVILTLACSLLFSGQADGAEQEQRSYGGAVEVELPTLATRTDARTNSQSSVNSEALDKSIQEVVKEPRFAWRLPREKLKVTEKGVIARFVDNAFKTLAEWIKAFFKWLDEVMRKLFRSRGGSGPRGSGWVAYLEVFAYAAAGVLLLGAAYLIFRHFKRRTSINEVVSQPMGQIPDLSDENVRADQFPEDEWVRMGKELLARGDMRLALRAFYLGSLSHLSGRGLITVARFKSNLEYYRELQRRAHALPIMTELFGTNLVLFERVWYGNHAVEPEEVNHFAENVQQMKGAQTG